MPVDEKLTNCFLSFPGVENSCALPTGLEATSKFLKIQSIYLALNKLVLYPPPLKKKTPALRLNLCKLQKVRKRENNYTTFDYRQVHKF